MPNQVCFEGVWYRRHSKTPNRVVASLFGTISLWRDPYQRSLDRALVRSMFFFAMSALWDAIVRPRT